MDPVSRRDVLKGGGAALALLALPLGPGDLPFTQVCAPRRACPHTGCRHHRPGDGGICGLSLHGEVVDTGPHGGAR